VSFADLLKDTWQTLTAHRLRTGLTMFGLAWGIVSITMMTAAGDGFREGQRRVMEKFGDNIVIVWAGRTSLQAGGERAGRKLWWITGHALGLSAFLFAERAGAGVTQEDEGVAGAVAVFPVDVHARAVGEMDLDGFGISGRRGRLERGLHTSVSHEALR